METPLVSVVITTYKRRPEMLLQAVECVRAQTYRPLEILVVSDNDPDSDDARAVGQALSPLADVRLIQLSRNMGAQVARNTGIRASSGEFVAFLDDDDLWMPDKLERQIPAFQDPRVGLVYCMGKEIADDPDVCEDYYTTKHGFKTVATFRDLLIGDCIGSTSQAVVRRECFDVCGYFDEHFRARQDYDRWLSITQKYRAVGIDKPLFVYRRHVGARITDSFRLAFESNQQVYRKYIRHFRRCPLACMNYYYTQAIVLKNGCGSRRYLKFALYSFLWNPVGFVKKYVNRKRPRARH